MKLFFLILMSLFTISVCADQLTSSDWWYSVNKANPKASELYKKAALAKDLNEKINIYTKIISRNGDDATAFVLRGIAAGKMGDLKSSVEDFNQAATLSPADPFPVINRAYAYLLLHKYQQSMSDYDQAIKLKASEASFYASRGYAYYVQNKFNESLADFKKALELEPDNAVYQHNIIIIESDQK